MACAPAALMKAVRQYSENGCARQEENPHIVFQKSDRPSCGQLSNFL